MKSSTAAVVAARFEIVKALSFSAAGGVYLGRDRDSGAEVVLREARPSVDLDGDGRDAVDRLRAEFDVLKRLESTGATPTPLAIVNQWEHAYLVQTRLPGITLAQWIAVNNPLLDPSAPALEYWDYLDRCTTLCVQIALTLRSFEGLGVAYRDLSLKNVLLEEQKSTAEDSIQLYTYRIGIVDFEGATLDANKEAIIRRTPGFGHPRSHPDGTPNPDETCYSLGMTMLACLFPITGLVEAGNGSAERLRHDLSQVYRIPSPLESAIKTMLDGRDSAMPVSVREVLPNLTDAAADLRQLRGRAERHKLASVPAHTSYKREVDSDRLNAVVEAVVRSIWSSRQVKRSDRLYPGDPEAFVTNGVSIAYGAAGVIYSLRRLSGRCFETDIEWLLDASASNHSMPPGLYVGLSGVAWCLLECGETTAAAEVFELAGSSPLLTASYGLLDGYSGYGMAALKMYVRLGVEGYLAQAVKVAGLLVDTARESDTAEVFWQPTEGGSITSSGYAHGRSGIALFLLYMYCTTGLRQYWEVGKRALATDIKMSHRRSNGVMSVVSDHADQGYSRPLETPYWMDGTAGLFKVAVRYYAVGGDTAVSSDVLEALARDLYRRYTVFPGFFRGLAGLGDALLDGYHFLGRPRWLDMAARLSHGIETFSIRDGDEIGFPGDYLVRRSMDFGTGAAGIALFLQRLERMGTDPAPSSDLVADESLAVIGDDAKRPVGRRGSAIRMGDGVARTQWSGDA